MPKASRPTTRQAQSRQAPQPRDGGRAFWLALVVLPAILAASVTNATETRVRDLIRDRVTLRQLSESLARAFERAHFDAQTEAQANTNPTSQDEPLTRAARPTSAREAHALAAAPIRSNLLNLPPPLA